MIFCMMKDVKRNPNGCLQYVDVGGNLRKYFP